MKSARIKSILLLFFLNSLFLFGQTPYEVTKKDYRPKKQLVHDFGNLFSTQENEYLERKLVDYDDSTSVQIVVVTFKELEGYPIETLANEIGERWGVGQKEQHNGIVIVVGEKERKVTLRGGYGIQSKMPPTVEKIIIEREIIPEFKKKNYFQGVDNAIVAIQKQLAGKYNKLRTNDEDDSSGWIVFVIFLALFIFFIASGKNRKDGGGNGGFFYYSGGRGSLGGFGGSGGRSSGGFGGFCGGSFGGGGATGSW